MTTSLPPHLKVKIRLAESLEARADDWMDQNRFDLAQQLQDRADDLRAAVERALA